MVNIHMQNIYLFGIDGTDIYFEPTKIRNCSIEVRPVENFDATFHPATITYTGITIGGVHTGTIHTTEAHYSYKSSLTGRGELKFCDFNSETHYVKSVMFSPEISAVAEKVLKGFDTTKTDKGTVYHLYSYRQSVSGGAIMSAMTSGDGFAQASIVNRMNQNYALASKCEELGVFLLRVIHGEFLPSEQKCATVDALLKSYNSLDWLVASNVIKYPTNDAERQWATSVEEKLRGVKLYRHGNRVYERKSVYVGQVYKSISKAILIPAFVLGILFLLIACSSTDVAYMFIVAMVLMGGAFLGFGISTQIEEPRPCDYYDC